ncbi:hypothetical protein CC1G_02396 [Coprinopsis cinerea okayama7|uniref:Integral membrane protein n=1 Tax=Coprinopsis cinerea (strain Okayama-7 / 130 / ATCC MYA-4618 / FGSC 9003) TaxID=240176 RepID=A8N7Y9_COPC7|nr:hypothetical protein CC1G_02396 [Coprinopsis cinerea okayama7\|eukprot:XP_001830945.2 hypothetical protein CC1G_02396 [Coprinopsis cinerea okayama7\
MLGEGLIISNYFLLGLRPIDTYPERARSYFTYSAYLWTPITMWLARISILTAMIRLVPAGRNQLITKISTVVFWLMITTIVFTRITMCGVPLPQFLACHPQPDYEVGLSLAFGLIGTAWLVGWPLYLLSRMKLAAFEKKIIQACFASGVSLIALDIAHATALLMVRASAYKKHYEALNTTGNLIVIVSVLCCNSLVLATYVYRLWRQRKQRQAEAEAGEESSSEPESSSEKCAYSHLPQPPYRTSVLIPISSSKDTTERTGPTATTHGTTMTTFGTHTTGIYTSIGDLTSIQTNGANNFSSANTYSVSGATPPQDTSTKGAPLVVSVS